MRGLCAGGSFLVLTAEFCGRGRAWRGSRGSRSTLDSDCHPPRTSRCPYPWEKKKPTKTHGPALPSFDCSCSEEARKKRRRRATRLEWKQILTGALVYLFEKKIERGTLDSPCLWRIVHTIESSGKPVYRSVSSFSFSTASSQGSCRYFLETRGLLPQRFYGAFNYPYTHYY